MVHFIEEQIKLNTERMKALALTLTRDSEDAKDLFQETLYRIWSHKESFEPGTNFRSWFYTIMMNLFKGNYVSRRRHRDILATQGALHYLYNQNGKSPNLGEWLTFNGEITAYLNSIDDKYGIPLKMRSEGYRYDEIADCLELPLNTLKSRIHKGRIKLSRLIG